MLVAIVNISSDAIKGALVLQFIKVNQCNGAFKKHQKREINNHALHRNNFNIAKVNVNL